MRHVSINTDLILQHTALNTTQQWGILRHKQIKWHSLQ